MQNDANRSVSGLQHHLRAFLSSATAARCGITHFPHAPCMTAVASGNGVTGTVYYAVQETPLLQDGDQ